jgi:hypothetical protein
MERCICTHQKVTKLFLNTLEIYRGHKKIEFAQILPVEINGKLKGISGLICVL